MSFALSRDATKRRAYLNTNRHPHQVLSQGTIDALRAEYVRGVVGHGVISLAKKYGLDRARVRRLVQGQSHRARMPTTVWDVFA
jgi:hypothetical protein